MSKVLLVTGASSDIGCRLIQTSEREYDVILAHYRTENETLMHLKGCLQDKLILLQSDFSIKGEVSVLIDQIEEAGYQPDHIVHISASKAVNLKFHKYSWERMEEGISVSLQSIVVLLQHFLPIMAKEKRGKVVFILSSYVLGLPPKYQSGYVVLKYALLGLMKSLAVEYADKGICVNGISPDMMETKFLSDIPELVLAQNAENSPLGRNLEVGDVIPALMYLLSDASNAVTGQNIGITGGMR